MDKAALLDKQRELNVSNCQSKQGLIMYTKLRKRRKHVTVKPNRLIYHKDNFQPLNPNQHQFNPDDQSIKHLLQSKPTQVKLTFRAPNDVYEQEADRVSEVVMRALVPTTATENNKKENSSIQLNEAAHYSSQLRNFDKANFNNLQSGGRPIEKSDKTFMETRFGEDFSHVRIHTNYPANQLARSISARAFTSGSDIVFARGEYMPETQKGRRLLAHELTHVMQQSRAQHNHSTIIQRQPELEQNPYEEQSINAGEQFRLKVIETASKWVDKEFITQSKIEEIRSRTKWSVESLPGLGLRIQRKKPNKNYTTCVEFAQMVFREAAKAEHQDDLKEAIKVAQLLPRIFNTYAKETQIQFTVEMLRNQLKYFEKPVSNLEQQKKKNEELIAELEGQQEETDKKQQLKRKYELKAAKARLKQVEIQLAKVLKQKRRQQARIEKEEKKLIEIQEKNSAWIKPNTTERPKNGDFILFGQVAKGQYSIKGGRKVMLNAGAFRHISVFKNITSEADEDSECETWLTIDGGGTKAQEKTYFVRFSDLMVFREKPSKIPPKHPWQAPQPLFLLLGWIDTEKLVNESVTQQ